jgi:ketosteroid isomerase-like protein
MSQENVEIVRNAFAAFDRGDIEGVLQLCDEDIVITQPPELPGVSREQHGTAGSWRPLRSGQSSGMTIESRS